MHFHQKPGWALSERHVTPHDVYLNRRQLVAGLAGAGLIGTSLFGTSATAQEGAPQGDPTTDLYPVAQNASFADAGRPLTDAARATTHNNYYEFSGRTKNIWRAAQQLPVRPWTLVIDGLVEEEMTLDMDELIRAMPLEERVYRLRCVETWSMVVPWSGFALRHLVERARPLSSAQYVVFETFMDPEHAPQQRRDNFPWPYREGLTMAEATNDLAFAVTGLYGEPVPMQNGAPLRLALPWKYGFKSIKGLVRMTFSDTRPDTFWSISGPREYGFWANVNPDVPHRRWSQAFETDIGTRERHATQIYNGYGDWVADLYTGLENEPLYM